MRIVVDTNVLMSGIFFGGIPGRILDAWAGGEFELSLSPEVLEEYHRVGTELAARYPERGVAFAPLLTIITMNAVLVNQRPLTARVSADPDDDKFLATARSAGASMIVSGDRHLLDVSGWQGITVLSPREFADRYLQRG